MSNIEDIINIGPETPTKTYKKGDIIQRPGSHNAAPIYVRKGLLKSYLIDSKGKEHIYTFCA